MTKCIIVTGGSGFIGTHLVEALVATGVSVVNIDLRPPRLERHRQYWRQIDLLEADVIKDLVVELRPDVVVNLAAVADIALHFDDMPVNFRGVHNLVDAIRASEIRPHLVHVSTQLVLGPGCAHFGPREYAPYTEYGKTKAASEEILWMRGNELSWTIVRPTNVWGPWHPSFATSTWKYLNRRWYMLPTGSNPVRSYGYVGNVVSQLVAATSLPIELIDHKIFYVGDSPIASAQWLDGFSYALTGKPVRRLPITLLALLAECGEMLNRIGRPAPLDRGRLHRITTDYSVPMEQSLAILGRGDHTLEQGIAQTVDWLRHYNPQEFVRS